MNVIFILEFFEGIRNPFLDGLFGIITRFGEETILILAAIVTMWCVSKRWGFFLLYTGLLGQIVNQSLKIACEIPRPWIAYPDFAPVSSAIKEATGYSFPSGHTQCVTSLFGGIAAINRKKPIVFFLCWAIVFLTGISRCYLGVHYPTDVLVSWIIGIILIAIFFRLFENYQTIKKPVLDLLRISAVLLCLGFCAYTMFSVSRHETVSASDTESISNAVKLSGAAVAFVLCWKIDERYIKYDTKAPLFGQIMKTLLGMVIIFAIKTFLKEPLHSLFGSEPAADFVRYFLIVTFAGTVWPLTFKFWQNFGTKSEKKF